MKTLHSVIFSISHASYENNKIFRIHMIIVPYGVRVIDNQSYLLKFSLYNFKLVKFFGLD